MSKPINPQKTQTEKDQGTWVQIGDAANQLLEKLEKGKPLTSANKSGAERKITS